ncbi:hypothetical protein [Kitasatospora cineracea]|uniref:hypothetical protein n=1 Tax=Kitasatospora cineracea TaxID=88074 RepID=UPI000F4E61CD|nr:hypothetical protein [Kitasatospora cineracea]
MNSFNIGVGRLTGAWMGKRAPAAALVAVQPAGLVVWRLLSWEVDSGSLAVLEASGAVAGLFLASRLVVRRSRARRRAEMRWLGQAVLQYVACCLTPFLVLTVVAALIVPDGEGDPGIGPDLALLGMVVIWVSVPTFVLLLVQAPRAQRGAKVGALVGLLPSALPMLLVLFGGWPLLLLVAAQLFFGFLVLQGHVPLSFLGLPALGAGSRPDLLPARGAEM